MTLLNTEYIALMSLAKDISLTQTYDYSTTSVEDKTILIFNKMVDAIEKKGTEKLHYYPNYQLPQWAGHQHQQPVAPFGRY